MDQEPIIGIGPADQLEYSPGEMMAAYRVKFEEAREAEDYHSLYRDFEFVVETAKLLATRVRHNATAQGSDTSSVGEEDYVSRSLWIAALVTYGRCFHHGRRKHLNESDFEGQSEEVLQWHRYFKDTRDKHVAHSVNPFEESATGVSIVDRESDAPRVDGAGVVYLLRAGEPVEVVEQLRRHAAWLQQVVYQRYNEAIQKVIDKANSLSKEELCQLPPLEMKPEMGFEAARKARR